MRIAGIVFGALALILLLPDAAWAFGPATHVYLGERLLDALYLLPQGIAGVLRAHPLSFLYGSVAADISFGKKYVPEGRHCHHWPVAREILETAENDRLRAVAFGYVGHLAADTIAHNFFIPRQLLLTSSTRALGHSYWEHRLDAKLGPGPATRARQVVVDYDHAEADALFDHVLSGTIFSFETNRRIFRGMIRVQDNDRWRNVFERMIHQSRWDLTDRQATAYLSRAFDYMVDYLLHDEHSVAATLDPTGENRMREAKQLRRTALKEGAWRDEAYLRELAEAHFPLPDERLGYWRRLRAPEDD